MSDVDKEKRFTSSTDSHSEGEKGISKSMECQTESVLTLQPVLIPTHHLPMFWYTWTLKVPFGIVPSLTQWAPVFWRTGSALF